MKERNYCMAVRALLLSILLTAPIFVRAFLLPDQSRSRNLATTPINYPLSSQPIYPAATISSFQKKNSYHRCHSLPVSVRRQRRSVSNVQTMGLFGLGAAEIAVILVAVVFIVGPNQLGNMAGNMAGRVKGEYDGLPDDLKKIPQEFQKGVEESTENSRARNAKLMEQVPTADKEKE